jgi:hypothetical protein
MPWDIGLYSNVMYQGLQKKKFVHQTENAPILIYFSFNHAVLASEGSFAFFCCFEASM